MDDCTRSPEFEFWMLRNPSFPQPHIHSADELFSHGVLLPLHLLPSTTLHKHNINPPPPSETPTSLPPPPDPDPGPHPSPAITDSSAATATLSASKRWKDIFRKTTDKKNAEINTTAEDQNNDRDKLEKAKKHNKKKKDRKGASNASSSSSSSSAAELNIINLWPFSRSRSAGNSATRPKLFPGAPITRRANSAPCSRSNSAGESKSRKWPSSPGRAGLHLGRSSPVWQVRRGGSDWSKRETSTTRRSKVSSTTTSAAASSAGGGGGKARVLNLNVPTCIGYRTHLSCRSDVNSAIGSNNFRCSNGNGNGNSNGGDGSNSSNVGGKHFSLRSLFTKKTLLTSH